MFYSNATPHYILPKFAIANVVARPISPALKTQCGKKFENFFVRSTARNWNASLSSVRPKRSMISGWVLTWKISTAAHGVWPPRRPNPVKIHGRLSVLEFSGNRSPEFGWFTHAVAKVLSPRPSNRTRQRSNPMRDTPRFLCERRDLRILRNAERCRKPRLILDRRQIYVRHVHNCTVYRVLFVTDTASYRPYFRGDRKYAIRIRIGGAPLCAQRILLSWDFFLSSFLFFRRVFFIHRLPWLHDEPTVNGHRR